MCVGEGVGKGGRGPYLEHLESLGQSSDLVLEVEDDRVMRGLVHFPCGSGLFGSPGLHHSHWGVCLAPGGILLLLGWTGKPYK